MSTLNRILHSFVLLTFVPQLVSCISSEDGKLDDSYPRECYPEVIDEQPPSPPPCNDDVCRQSATRTLEPGRLDTWLTQAFPTSPKCQENSPSSVLRLEAGDCVVTFSLPAPPTGDDLCQPILVHEYAATLADLEVRLARLAIDGVTQTPELPRLLWYGPDWPSSHAWRMQQEPRCQPPATVLADDARAEIELRVPLEVWVRIQGPRGARLVVPKLTRREP